MSATSRVDSSAATLLEIARDPRHLGAEIGFFSVLHTWDQRLQHHPHVHCVLAGGGLAPDHSRWIAGLSNKESAQRLAVTEATIKTFMSTNLCGVRST